MAGKLSTFTKKRIFADVRELQDEESSEFWAEPLEDNIFEWHFTIRGPKETDFEGGIYHGRILLPSDYPFKPPNIIFLTPNGRFEAGKKICLSISAYHPEEWQAAWGIRLILEALISFLPTEGGGAVGALDWSSPERRRLALASQEFCCQSCSCKGRIANMLPEPKQDDDDEDEAEGEERSSCKVGSGGGGGAAVSSKKKTKKKPSKYAGIISQLHCHNLSSPAASPAASPAKAAAAEGAFPPPISPLPRVEAAAEDMTAAATTAAGRGEVSGSVDSFKDSPPSTTSTAAATAAAAAPSPRPTSSSSPRTSSSNMSSSTGNDRTIGRRSTVAAAAAEAEVSSSVSPRQQPQQRRRQAQQKHVDKQAESPRAAAARATHKAAEDVALQRADLPLRVLTLLLKGAIAYLVLRKAARVGGFAGALFI